jgi:hypothetical protein
LSQQIRKAEQKSGTQKLTTKKKLRLILAEGKRTTLQMAEAKMAMFLGARGSAVQAELSAASKEAYLAVDAFSVKEVEEKLEPFNEQCGPNLKEKVDLYPARKEPPGVIADLRIFPGVGETHTIDLRQLTCGATKQDSWHM